MGMLLNAVQFVFEETLLKDRAYPPLQVVGWEGVWGFCLCLFVALPITYFIPAPVGPPGSGTGIGGHYENALDAFVIIVKSSMPKAKVPTNSPAASPGFRRRVSNARIANEKPTEL